MRVRARRASREVVDGASMAGMATTWQGGGYTSRNGRVGGRSGGERRESGESRWREGGGGRAAAGWGERERERAERELTPLPRHQIASFSPLSPSLAGKRQRGGAPSSSPAAAAPPPLGRRKETCRGWRVGGKGVYNWRRAYARRRAPCEERRGKRVEGPVEKREAIAKKGERERERRRRDLLPPGFLLTRAPPSRTRAYRKRILLHPFLPIFPFCLLLFFSAPSRAHARFHLLSR